jgi:hypothetical protein
MRRKIVSLVVVVTLFVGILAFGVQIGGASTWSVGSGKTFSTIMSAVNAASAGDTILVYPGTYYEEVDISKPLNIISTGGASQTFIDGSTGVTLASAGLVKITAGGNVTFSGFTVENAPLDPSLNEFEIYSSSSTSGVTYVIANNNIVGTGDTSPSDFEVGFYSQHDQANVVFKYNNITNIGGNNIVFEVHTGTTEISYNNLAAGLAGGDSVFFMTYNGTVPDGTVVSTLQNVSGNTFNMGVGPFDYADHSSGISFCTPSDALSVGDGEFTNVLIKGNVFNNLYSNRRGIGFWNGASDGEGGTVAPIVQYNVVNGVGSAANSSGVDFIGANAATNATVSYNTISNCATGVDLRSSGCAPGLKVNYNDFVGNNAGLNNTFGPSSVDARYNYWGDSSGPGGSGPGTGQPVFGNVTFDPWLSNYQLPVSAQVVTNPALIERFAYGGIQFTDFNVSIAVQNVADLYGFEFNMTWDNSLIHLVGVEYAPELNQIWGSASNWTMIQNVTLDGWYDLVALALGTTKGYTYSGTTTLAKLTFRTVNLPCYIAPNYQLQTRLHFSTVKLSNHYAQAISATVNDGQYLIHAEPPLLQVLPASIVCRKLNQNSTIQIEIMDALNVSGIDVQIKYNTTLLTPSLIQWDDLSGFLPGPYLVKTYSVDSVNGLIRFQVVENTTANPPLGIGDCLLANVTFTVIKAMIWKNATGWTNYMEDSINLTNWNVTVCCSSGSYSLTGNLVITSGTDYRYVPIQGDVDSNGNVNILDLASVSMLYNVKSGDPRYNPNYDLNNDGIIDIYDLVYIATNFGYKYDP